jgi:hypothetical protein
LKFGSVDISSSTGELSHSIAQEGVPDPFVQWNKASLLKSEMPREVVPRDTLFLASYRQCAVLTAHIPQHRFEIMYERRLTLERQPSDA